MTRPSPLAPGLLALALALAATPGASADEPKAKDAHAPAAAEAAKHDATPATPPDHRPRGDADHRPRQPGRRARGRRRRRPRQPNILAASAAGDLDGDRLRRPAPVLGRFAWKPLMKALHDREEHVEHCLLEAERPQ